MQCGCGQLGPAVKLLSSSVLSSASFLNCPQLSGSWPGTGHRAVSRTNEGAQFCMLASTRGSVSRVVSPGHVAATLLCINYTFKDSIHCRLQEEDLWQWKDNL